MERVLVENLEQMSDFAGKIANLCQAGDVLCLHGDLGAGKTTFAQLFAKHLDIIEHDYVSSPSFAILHEYKARFPIYHMDFYRLGSEDEVIDLGFEEYFYKNGVCVIEWSERLGSATPEDRLDIKILISGEKSREIQFTGHGDGWLKRLFHPDQ